MSGRDMRVAQYWFWATFARRWTGYLAIVLLVGLVGGIAIGSISAARRTQSSFDVFLAKTNPSDMNVVLYAPNVTSDLLRLPLVRHVAAWSYLNAIPAGHHGTPLNAPALRSGAVVPIGSLTGEYFTQDKVTAIEGRTANPKRADEFDMTAGAERLMGWHVGQTIPMYFYTYSQSSLPAFGTAKVKPHFRMTMHLVGTVIFNDQVVTDEVERRQNFMIFTPAITRLTHEPGPEYFGYALKLDHGARDVSAVEREIIEVLPRGTTYTFQVTSITTGKVNRSIEPEAIALGVFGLIAGLAALIIAGGLIARALQSAGDDLKILRALGGGPSMTASASLLGVLGAIITGAALAVGVGVALSPISPIGPVRAVYPNRGIAFDWPVLGTGFVVLLIGLGSIAVVIATRRAHRPMLRQPKFTMPSGSKVARHFAGAGLPVTAVVGVRFAIETGRDRDAVPVRSALLGAVLAVTIVVATLTFGSSLGTLVSHPSLYGWNWDYALVDASNDVPPQSTSLLNADPYVAAWSGVNFANAQINGLTVPIILAGTHAVVSPPMLSGHEVDANNQIVLGVATLQQLHQHVGGTVLVTYGTAKDAPVYVPPTRMLIVGTTTLPAVGGALSLHTSMGIGAIIPVDIEPPAFRKYIRSADPTLNGPEMVFVRLRKGVSSARAMASLKRIAAVGDRALYAVPDGAGAGGSVSVLPVQYPAEIENYRAIGATPSLLALGLAAGAVVALGLTLTASVRRRRRDLALLRTLGFTRRQLMATVAWQASVSGVIGVILGVPIGIVLGKWLWNLFARSIYAVPDSTVPVISVVIVAVSAFVLANIVAVLPGRNAARTSTAQVLRDE